MVPALDPAASVASVVTAHAVTARVFQRHGIDFCCRGQVSVSDAAAARRLDVTRLTEELAAAIADRAGAPDDDPRRLSTPALLDRIVERHHRFARQAIDHLRPLVAKVARVHRDRGAAPEAVHAAFEALAAALLPHLDEEEQVLFPALRGQAPVTLAIRAQLARMQEDHLAVGDLLASVRERAEGFALPPWACNTYRVVMQELEALEGDTLRHVHLENHVLAPRFAG